MRPQKYLDVADRLAARVRNGDYNLAELPAERELAAQTGVSYATARKAVQHLVEKRVLRRLPNGRAMPSAGGDKAAQIAFLTPAWESHVYVRWRHALSVAAAKRQASVRRVLYTHWDDPIIAATVRGFDGTFLIPEPEPRPRTLVESLRHCGRPIVVLEDDWTNLGFRSIVTTPDFCVHRLLDHLAALGHRRIDYFNVQPGLVRFLQPWRLWLAAQRLAGDCIDEPVKPYEETLPAAYAILDRRIKAGKFKAKALVCTSETAAQGAVAALVDNGLRPGRDVAVCAAEYGSSLVFHNPSISSLAAIDLIPYAAVSLDWMAANDPAAWPGPLLLHPADVQIAARQTTAPNAADHRKLQ